MCKLVLTFHSICDAQYQENRANENDDYDYTQGQVAEEYDSQYEQESFTDVYMVEFYRWLSFN